jgi:hypothetical protein
MIKAFRASLARINASSTVMICTVLPRPGSSPSSPPPSATALNSHRTPSTWSRRRTCEGEVVRQMRRQKRARPERARSNALMRVHDRCKGRGSGEALATRGRRRMHGRGRAHTFHRGRAMLARLIPATSARRAASSPAPPRLGVGAGAAPEALAPRDAPEAVEGEGGAARARGISSGGPTTSAEASISSAPASGAPAARPGGSPPTAACPSSTMGVCVRHFTTHR